jgi:Mg2+-importing ATPase
VIRERWLRLLIGIGFFAGVIVVARYFSEEQAFVRLARQVNPYWFIAAFLLQVGTYATQGEIWRKVGQADAHHVSLWTVYKLALMKLFVDQALPSGGFSGSLIVGRVLDHHAFRHPTIYAAAVVNTTSFFFAYVLSLAVAVAVLILSGHDSPFVVALTILFMIISAGIALAMLSLCGKDVASRLGGVGRFFLVRSSLNAMKDADTTIVRNTRIQADATLFQMLTFLLDGLTLWTLVRSLGVAVTPGHAFASFMIANLVRTVGVVPAGLGTFDATAVLMLRMEDISVAAALAATVLFRVITFVLPMAPGLWFSRHLLRHKPPQYRRRAAA